MHELSLMESLIELAEAEARAHHAERIRIVRVEVGALALIDSEALRFCFDAVAEETLARGAQFEIVETEAAGWCGRCGAETPMTTRFEPCRRCGGAPLTPTRGDALRLLELEIE